MAQLEAMIREEMALLRGRAADVEFHIGNLRNQLAEASEEFARLREKHNALLTWLSASTPRYEVAHSNGRGLPEKLDDPYEIPL